MGDDCVLLVDDLLNHSTHPEPVSDGRDRIIHTISSEDESEKRIKWNKRHAGESFTPGKLVECRICKEDDEGKNMESPCSCTGSLKFAHRKCVQRWCDEKGDTTCEICQQAFKPGYFVMPQLFPQGRPINMARQYWEVFQHGSQGNGSVSMFDRDPNFLDLDCEYNFTPSSRAITCWRFVAVIFTVLLILRHIVSILLTTEEESALSLITTWALFTAGVLIPVYVMARLLSAIQRRQQQQGRRGWLHVEDERSRVLMT